MLLKSRLELEQLIETCVKSCYPSLPQPLSVNLEIPHDKRYGDYACTLALRLAKALKKNPYQLAQEIISSIEKGLERDRLKDQIKSIEIQKPGFINFTLSSQVHYETLYEVVKQKNDYGRSDFGKGEKVLLEFVSANPTGPLSVAHARQAAVGDCLANIFNFMGFDLKKEFYVNDEGNQINILGRSLRHRAQEILGMKIDFPQDGYQGDYIRDLAQEFLRQQGIKDLQQLDEIPAEDFSLFGVKVILTMIKKELSDFRVPFDRWTHQSQVADPGKIRDFLPQLKKEGWIYEQEGALWFKTSYFGDDKDRVIRKTDGSFTYFAPDIIYHKDKFERGFTRVINIWGPDHHGYIPRLKAAVQALGHREKAIEVLIIQLATIYREGKPVSMSTRRGQYISLQEVMDEVGVDAARFFFLMRHIDCPLDFDLELAKKETPENPVYYIQYAHARICSIEHKAQAAHLLPQSSAIHRLEAEEEFDLMKTIGNFPDILIQCYQQRDPYPLVPYLQSVATSFHRFYDKHRVIDQDQELASERITLIMAAKIVLANGLRLMGVSAPGRM